MSCLPKPVLRGHNKRRGLFTIIGSLTAAGLSGAYYHFTVTIPRKKAYDEFYKTYDPVAHFKELQRMGYLQYPHHFNELLEG